MRARIEQVARDVGADDVGVAPAHRLGGEPSMDTDYLLPGTRSVISVMVAFDPDIVRQYLAKEDREAMHRHETECYRRLDRVAHSVARVLEEAGHRTAVTEPNLDYRYKSKPAYRHIPPAIRQAAVDWMARDGSAPVRAARRSVVRRVPAAFLGAGNFRLTPTFAHRYGAVAAGIGSLGWSGNVLHPDHGARTAGRTRSDPAAGEDLRAARVEGAALGDVRQRDPVVAAVRQVEVGAHVADQGHRPVGVFGAEARGFPLPLQAAQANDVGANALPCIPYVCQCMGSY